MTHRLASSKEIDEIFMQLPNDEFNAAYDEVERNGDCFFKIISGKYKLINDRDCWPTDNIVEVRRWWKKEGEK